MYRASVAEPFTEARAVTPNDGADLPLVGSTGLPRSLYIGVAGDVTAIAANDSTAVTFSAVGNGILPGSFRRVMATGTTATGIVALY